MNSVFTLWHAWHFVASWHVAWHVLPSPRVVSPDSLWKRLGLGNYDVNVLEVALGTHGMAMAWWDRRNRFSAADDAVRGCEGVLVNRLSSTWLGWAGGLRHWSAIRRLGGQWFDCDSLLREPLLLSVAQLEALLQEAMEKRDGFCLLVSKETQR